MHHDPTPGLADGEWMYGHNWVCLAMLRCHPSFGVLALPLLSHLYVRQTDVGKLAKRHAWNFRTKHELALDLCDRTIGVLRALGSKAEFLVAFDGAYAAAKLIQPLMDLGATVVTRLRRNAQLFDLPKPSKGRGRPRIYGRQHISLAKRAGYSQGWQPIRYARRGVMTDGRCKTFLTTIALVGGMIRVVLLEHPGGNWAACGSIDPTMPPEAILEAVSDRWAIEEQFHDVKDAWGAGQQKVRNVWSNVACWNLCGWLYSMFELACWDEPAEQLGDRTDRPWDNPSRRTPTDDEESPGKRCEMNFWPNCLTTSIRQKFAAASTDS